MKCDHNNKVTTSIITESGKSMFPNNMVKTWPRKWTHFVSVTAMIH